MQIVRFIPKIFQLWVNCSFTLLLGHNHEGISCALYYKYITMVNDDSSVVNKWCRLHIGPGGRKQGKKTHLSTVQPQWPRRAQGARAQPRRRSRQGKVAGSRGRRRGCVTRRTWSSENGRQRDGLGTGGTDRRRPERRRTGFASQPDFDVRVGP